MKIKTLVAIVALSALSVSAFAQGALEWKNAGAALVNVSYDGAPAVKAGAADNVTVELWVQGGAMVSSLVISPVAVPFNGLYNGGVVQVPGQTAGSDVTLEIRAYSANSLVPQVATQTLSPITLVTFNGTTPPNGTMAAGMQPMTVMVTTVPEPSTIILGLLGAGVLLLRRRK